MLSVIQFSDTHFSRPGHRSHGGSGYDTDAAWAASMADAFGPGTEPPDLTVVTGDVVDNGELDEYAVAAERLADIPTPVTVLAGNHDAALPLSVALPRPGVTLDRTLVLGSWLFVFLDSNGDGQVVTAEGRAVDHPRRVEAKGGLGAAEVAWFDDVLAASAAEHVFVWLHHPPGLTGRFAQPAFDTQVEALVGRHDRIRGFGAGHAHTDACVEVGGRPVWICPAQTVNFVMGERRTLPPGYRRYAFADDGTVTSRCRILEPDEIRWPERILPPLVPAES